jgi:hypothetical protein
MYIFITSDIRFSFLARKPNLISSEFWGYPSSKIRILHFCHFFTIPHGESPKKLGPKLDHCQNNQAQNQDYSKIGFLIGPNLESPKKSGPKSGLLLMLGAKSELIGDIEPNIRTLPKLGSQ